MSGKRFTNNALRSWINAKLDRFFPIGRHVVVLDLSLNVRDALAREIIAERIIAARPFKSADDLQRVKGIGAGKRYEKIRPFFN